MKQKGGKIYVSLYGRILWWFSFSFLKISLMLTHSFFFFFCSCFWCSFKKKKNHTRMYLKKLTSKFSSRGCTVSGLTFKFFIHFELIFGYAVRQGSRFSNTVYSRDDRSPLYIPASFVINGPQKNFVFFFP